MTIAMRTGMMLIAIAALSGAALAADGSVSVAAAPASETAASSTASPLPPATAASFADDPEKIDPRIDTLLTRAQKAGDEIDRLFADFDYDFNETLIDRHDWRTGRITYRKPNQIFIEFTDLGKETFRFDGRVYVEDRPAQKQRYVYRFVKEADPPIEDLDIDKVPFPLPFGQKRDKVLKTFDVTYGGKEKLKTWEAPGKKPIPAGDTEYDHLVLVPKRGTRIARDYVKIEFWLDPADGLPRQIRMEDQSERILTIRFRDMKKNDDVKASDDLFTEGKMPEGWDRNYEDLTERKQ